MSLLDEKGPLRATFIATVGTHSVEDSSRLSLLPHHSDGIPDGKWVDTHVCPHIVIVTHTHTHTHTQIHTRPEMHMHTHGFVHVHVSLKLCSRSDLICTVNLLHMPRSHS